METLLIRYRSVSILVAVLMAQMLMLAVQVRRPAEAGEGRGPRLIRVWAVRAITPLEKAVVGAQHSLGGLWENYVWLRGVRRENADLREQLERIRLEQIRLVQDAAQARRLQALFGFKEQFIAQTVAAQVIGSSGTEQSRTVYLDKGANDGIRPDMAVISPDGIVGKVLRTFAGSSQVLLITDAQSGAGAILEKSRLQGTIKGTAAGEILLDHIMSDEKVETGETVLSSGGDRVFPKGLLIGTVKDVSPGPELFLNIRVKPAAQISRLEEVLVITKVEEKQAEPSQSAGPVRAADVLAQRLPTVAKPEAAAAGAATAAPPSPQNGQAANPRNTGAPPTMAEFLRQQKEREKEKAHPASANPGAPKPKPAENPAPQPPPAEPPRAQAVPEDSLPRATASGVRQ